MASDPSKTERATPKRREKARGEGNVPKAQEITKTLSLLVGICVMYLYISIVIERFQAVFIYFFKHGIYNTVDEAEAYNIIQMLAYELAILVLPVCLVLFLASYIVLRLQVGKLWTTKVFKIKWQNFNIFKGLKNLFLSPQTLVRLGKSIGFAIIIGVIPYWYIMDEYPNFLNLYHLDARGLGAYMLYHGFWLVLYSLIPMCAIALFDLWYTRYSYEENLKMTKDEVKDEAKQAEGDPMIKQKQKQKMMEVLQRRMFQDIPRADVVITNPTHFAVALMYDPTVSSAPLVVAKGADHVAQRIKEIAAENNVPIRENKPLAQALYKQVEIGETIPEDLYKAVAALLAQIWKLRGKGMPGK